MQLHPLQRDREHPRLEAHQRSTGGAEIAGRLLDQRQRRRREHLVERLARRQHAARQDVHLRHRVEHLGEVDLLDQQVGVLERGFERRVQADRSSSDMH